ncbi:MAG: hypothetical protein WKF59_16730 [Chitinophagaceae bacterium]
MKTKIMSSKTSCIKLLVCMGIIICSISTAGAQGNLPKYNSDVLVPKPTVIKSSATGNHVERNVTVQVWIEKDQNLGYVVYFKSSALLGDVEIKGTDPLLETQINTYEGKVDNGKFNLDAPAYKGRQNYTLTFFAQGMPEAIWTAEIKIKKQDFKIKTIPKNT